MLFGIVAALTALFIPSAASAADGDLVPAFGGTGKAARSFGSSFGASTPTDAAVDANGRLVVVGTADGDIGVARINPDGSYNGGYEYNVALGLLGLLFFVMGGGAFAIDRLFRRKKSNVDDETEAAPASANA